LRSLFPFSLVAITAVGLCPLAVGACSSKSSPAAATDDGGTPDDGAAAAADASGVVDAGDPWQAVHDELFGGKWISEGLVIMLNGQIVHEEYAAGYTKDMPHLTYSVSKSIGGTLIGFAQADGLLKLSDSICTYITKPATADATLCDSTVEHVLHMSSGLTWAEDYGTDPTTSNVLQMLYGDIDDMGSYAASLPRAAPAGTKWQYSSGDANILSLVSKGALKGQDERAYAKTKLFDPAGITTATFEEDRSGSLVFSSSWYVTPRDMAKMGQLYLDDGKVNGKQVLPAGWVKYATTPAPPVAMPSKRDPMQAAPGDTGGSYGAQIWLNAATPTAPDDTLEFSGVPNDTYSFEGHYGQKIFVVPSRKLVVARVGNDRKVTFDPGPMMVKAVAAADAIAAGAQSASNMDRVVSRSGVGASAQRAAVLDVKRRPIVHADDVPHLLTGFSAKETCSCAFVVGQTDDYCKAFGQQQGFNLVITIDHSAQKITSTYQTLARTASAKAGAGCTLDPY
jgi:CubicO group peptidase (beta-lactamase class C family)